MKLKKFDRVEIVWLDSVHVSGWRRLPEWESEGKADGHGLEHKSIGYLLINDKEAVSICQSRNDLSDKFIETVDAIMTIPRVAVLSIKRI